ncbi:hypothetical protein PR048_023703 [Dryococelus australis]|uniref:Uncharacterized protein n=1 Tax=Dryococelus australis TaxID=614101 RepID=A0ABQ9GUV5_9NEOP|nr:hypothetical protein PR048_023703 [Dryococelus australis]
MHVHRMILYFSLFERHDMTSSVEVFPTSIEVEGMMHVQFHCRRLCEFHIKSIWREGIYVPLMMEKNSVRGGLLKSVRCNCPAQQVVDFVKVATVTVWTKARFLW